MFLRCRTPDMHITDKHIVRLYVLHIIASHGYAYYIARIVPRGVPIPRKSKRARSFIDRTRSGLTHIAYEILCEDFSYDSIASDSVNSITCSEENRSI